MKTLAKITLPVIGFLILSCGGNGEGDTSSSNASSEPAETTEAPQSKVKASERVDLENKGVGPVKSVTLDPEIDRKLAVEGKDIYDQMCIACHKADTKFIGPAPKGILDRRTPEWVMNMILNPEVMVVEDPLAKDLLMEFNGSPMANQGLSEDEARAILEYFRTL